MMLIFWLLIAYLAYQLIMKNNPNIFTKNNSVISEQTATEILKLRYVNGEIDEETYRKMLENIK